MVHQEVTEQPTKAAVHIVVPCAGVGSRAQALDADAQPIPKQYAQLCGASVVQHTLQALSEVQGVSSIVVVLSPEDEWFEHVHRDWLAQYCQRTEHNSALPRIEYVFCGGTTRAHSVRNGVLHVQEQGAGAQDWVLVHDAARCLVQAAWVESLIANVQSSKACGGLLALPLADTLKQQVTEETEKGEKAAAVTRVASTQERAGKWLAQTPQMFRLEGLLRGLEHVHDGITDESSAMEQLGLEPLLVRGHSHNFKVTYPEDFWLAEAILSKRVLEAKSGIQ